MHVINLATMVPAMLPTVVEIMRHNQNDLTVQLALAISEDNKDQETVKEYKLPLSAFLAQIRRSS